jgi:putative DNA primase/helicase
MNSKKDTSPSFEGRPPERVGRRLHDPGQLPYTLRQDAQAHWGAGIEFSTSRENGSYVGPVISSGTYLVQRVSERSVVVHRLADVEFPASEGLRRRANENRLNGAQMQISYGGEKAAAHLHDPERAAIEEIFERIHRTAEERLGEEAGAEGLFARQLDEVKKALIEKLRPRPSPSGATRATRVRYSRWAVRCP